TARYPSQATRSPLTQARKWSSTSTRRRCSAGVLTSSTTSLPASMVTLSPATGTLRLGQVAGSDHFVAFAAVAPEFWACTTVNTLTSNDAEINGIRRNERFFFLMTGTSDTGKMT